LITGNIKGQVDQIWGPLAQVFSSRDQECVEAVENLFISLQNHDFRENLKASLHFWSAAP